MLIKLFWLGDKQKTKSEQEKNESFAKKKEKKVFESKIHGYNHDYQDKPHSLRKCDINGIIKAQNFGGMTQQIFFLAPNYNFGVIWLCSIESFVKCLHLNSSFEKLKFLCSTFLWFQ